MWRFDTETLQWTYIDGPLDQVEQSFATNLDWPYPHKNSYSWIYDEQLCFFGGYFRPTDCKKFLRKFQRKLKNDRCE